mmetsp:Transcript_56952/g.90746  ORF Transcript_56952/g.90746 Transcript_56952/m.90746 type:complete len:121 (-) Transcript_56952:503-865(-)
MADFVIINPANIYKAVKVTWGKYQSSMATHLKVIDMYIVYIILTAFAQIAYAAVIGTTYPFNSLLSGVCACIGSFVLAVSLRFQLNANNDREYNFSQERAFADFIIGNVILHFTVISYLG